MAAVVETRRVLQDQNRPPPHPANILVFALIFPTMVALLQLKYQGSDTSPFETHFAEMFLSVTSFLIYCFSHDALLKTPPDSNHAKIVQFFAFVFGPLTLASFLSLLFHSLRPFLYTISVLYSATRLLYSTLIERLNWLYHKFALFRNLVNSTDTDSSENHPPA